MDSVEVLVDLKVSARTGRGCTVVGVSGELDMDTSPELQDFLRDVVGAGARQVVLDLAEVTFMDSSGLASLVVSLELLRDSGGRLCAAAAQEPVRYVLTVSAVDRVLQVYDSVQAAEDDMPPVTV